MKKVIISWNKTSETNFPKKGCTITICRPNSLDTSKIKEMNITRGGLSESERISFLENVSHWSYDRVNKPIEDSK